MENDVDNLIRQYIITISTSNQWSLMDGILKKLNKKLEKQNI